MWETDLLFCWPDLRSHARCRREGLGCWQNIQDKCFEVDQPGRESASGRERQLNENFAKGREAVREARAEWDHVYITP